MNILNKFRKQIIITSTIANIFVILELLKITNILGYDLSVYKGIITILISTLLQLGIITSKEGF